MRNVWVALVGAFFLTFSLFAYSTTVEWGYNVGKGYETGGGSAPDACSAYWSEYLPNGWAGEGFSGDVQFADETHAYCLSSNTRNSVIEVFRVGDTCSTGQIISSTTGGCISTDTYKAGELCKDQTGARTSADPMIYDPTAKGCVLMTDSSAQGYCPYMASISTAGTQYNVKGTLSSSTGLPTAPPTFATGDLDCEVATVVSSECLATVKGEVNCVVTGKFTGNVVADKSSTKDMVCGSTDNPCPTIKESTTLTNTPCIDANGTCTTATETDKTGTQQCGSFNGASVCTYSAPKSTATVSTVSAITTANADGSADTVTTTNATQTDCTDIATCTSKSSTTSTTTHTTSTGTTTATSTTCTGTCSGSSSALSGSGTDGDGDSGGDLASYSKVCTSPPPCSGDVFLCAVLKQEWSDSCAVRALPTDEEQQTFDAKVAAMQAKIDANQATLDSTVDTLVQTFKSSTSASSSTGKCFVDKSVNVLGRTVVIPFSDVCQYLVMLRYAMLAMAFLISLRMLSREL